MCTSRNEFKKKAYYANELNVVRFYFVILTLNAPHINRRCNLLQCSCTSLIRPADMNLRSMQLPHLSGMRAKPDRHPYEKKANFY